MSYAARVSTVLLGVSITLLISSSPLTKVNWSDGYVNFANGASIGIAVGLLEIIIIISFVQCALDKQVTKNEKIDEFKKNARYNKYLQIILKEYTVYYNCVVTPPDKRLIRLDKGFVSEFALNDMSGMYYAEIKQIADELETISI